NTTLTRDVVEHSASMGPRFSVGIITAERLRAVPWPSWAFPREPPSREPRPAQPPHDVRIRLHDAPHQPGAVVLDHRDDRSLVYPQVIDVEPAGRAALRKRRIERVAEAVGGEQAGAVGLAHGPERGDGDLGRERDRAARRGGRERAVVGGLGERRPARPVAAELALAPAERARYVARAVGGGESPDTTAVAGPAARVRRGVRLLRVRGAARVLEVVDAARLHVGVVAAPEVDPHVR